MSNPFLADCELMPELMPAEWMCDETGAIKARLFVNRADGHWYIARPCRPAGAQGVVFAPQLLEDFLKEARSVYADERALDVAA